MSKAKLELYAVMNEEGQYLRSRGYGGGGNSWVDEFESAKVYQKIGPARARVTWFSNRYPEYGIPKLVRLSVTKVQVLDDSEHLKKKEDKKKATNKRALESKKRRTKEEIARLKKKRARGQR